MKQIRIARRTAIFVLACLTAAFSLVAMFRETAKAEEQTLKMQITAAESDTGAGGLFDLNPVANLYDGDVTTGWMPNKIVPVSEGNDFPADVTLTLEKTVTLDKVRLYAAENHFPSAFKIQTSEDGATFIDAKAVTDYTAVPSSWNDFEIEGAPVAKYVRIHIEKSGTVGDGEANRLAKINEIEIFGTLTRNFEKLTFSSVSCADGVWSDGFPVTNLINGNRTDIAAVGTWGMVGFYQTFVPIDFEMESEEIVDRIVVSLYPDFAEHTVSFLLQASKDGVAWADMKYVENTSSKIMNSAVTVANRSDDSIVIDFKPVSAKYFRLIMVVKETWGSNALGCVSEVEAYVGDDVTAADVYDYDFGKALSFTVTAAEGVHSGDKVYLNDGKNKYFTNTDTDSLIRLYEKGTITMSFENTISPAYIRLYRDGYDVKSKTACADGVVNEDALLHEYPIVGVSFYGSTDGSEWFLLSDYRDLSNYIFAQDFALDASKEIKYLQLRVEQYSAVPLTTISEIEVFGTEKGVVSLSVSSVSHKTVYYVNETLDVSGLTLLAEYADGNSETVSVTENMVSGFDSSAPAANRTLTVTYGGKTVTFDVEIRERELTGISVTSPADKLVYTEGEDLDVSGLKITAVYNVGDPEVLSVTEDMISGFDSSLATEEQELTVTYKGKTTTYTIRIKELPEKYNEKIAIENPEVVTTDYVDASQLPKFTDGDVSSSVAFITMGTWGFTSFYNTFEPVTFTVSGGPKLIDRAVINLEKGLNTCAFMIEVSPDKENWAVVDYVANDDVVIENNAVRLADRNNDYFAIDFQGVTAAYVRFTALLKNYNGGTALVKLTEISVYRTPQASEHTLTYGKEIGYTASGNSVDQSGSLSALNDGKNLYFGFTQETDNLILFGSEKGEGNLKADAYVIFNLEGYVKNAKVRLFPMGYDVKSISLALSGVEGTVIDEDAFVNKTTAKALRFEVSNDGETWKTVAEFNDVKPYDFAQDFVIGSDYTFRYIKMTVVENNALSGGATVIAEAKIYAEEVADFEYREDGLAEIEEAKRVYLKDQQLDLDGFTLKVTSNDGGMKVKFVEVTADMISGFDTSSYGLKTATVTYAGLSVEYAYAVAEVESVEVASAPAKLVYELGEKADVTGLTIKVNFFYTENGERKTGEFTLPVTEKMVSLDTSVGNLEARLVITFEGKETYAEVKVRAVESIVLNTENVKKSYYERGLLNVEGLTAEVTYNTGDRETVTVTEEMVSGFDSSVPVERQTLTVTYCGQTATYEVEIKKLPDTDDPSGGDKGNKGCGGSISASGILVLSAIAAVAAVIRKKEDR